MEALLVFPPPAQPSYIPYGVSLLSQRLKDSGFSVPVLDLNIASWKLETSSSPDALNWQKFCHNGFGTFYSREDYRAMLPTRSTAFAWTFSIEEEAKLFLEKGMLSPILGRHFEHHKALIEDRAADTLFISALFLPQLVLSLALAAYLKDHKPLTTIYLGGAALSCLDSRKLSEYAPFIDGLYEGEGEERIVALMEKNGREKLPVPVLGKADYSGLNLNDYYVPEIVLPASSSRSCSWRRCSFCAHNFSFGKYRQKDTVQFAEELLEYRNLYNCRSFYLPDQYISGKDAEKIALEIRARVPGIYYHFMGRPSVEDYTESCFETLSSSGCSWISWGVESGSDRLLEVCGKGTCSGGIEKVLAWSHRSRISNLLMMIFGLPTSGKADLDLTIEFLSRVSPYTHSMTESSFILFDNTPFGIKPAKYGLFPHEAEELCRIKDRTVFTYRRRFSQIYDGVVSAYAGSEEISRFHKVRHWILDDSIYSHLPAEHYLLYTIFERENFKGLPSGYAA